MKLARSSKISEGKNEMTTNKLLKRLNKKYAKARVVNGYIVGDPWKDGIANEDDLHPCFRFDFPIWGVRDDDERIEKAANSETSNIFKTLVFKNSALFNAKYVLFVYVPRDNNERVNRRARLEVFTTHQEIADYLECHTPLLEMETDITMKTLSWGRELTTYEKEGVMEAVRRMVCTNIHIYNGCEMAA